MSRERQSRESWGANAAAWTRAVRQGAIASRIAATNDAVVEAVLALGPQRILDVGAGEGWLAHRLQGEGVEVVGFDASDALIAEARRGPGTFHVLDYDGFVAEPGRVAGPFDVVVCNFSLLGEEIDGLLRTMAGVLTPGGRLVVQTVHPWTVAGQDPAGYRDGWREEDFRAMGEGFEATMPWYFRTLASWVAALAGAGFRIEECREPRHPETGVPLSLLWIAAGS